MINNIVSRIAKADDLKSVDALQIAINNGTIPGYIGVPMIAELVKQQKEAQALAAGAPQTTVTDQVMQEARGIAMPQQPMPYQMGATERPPIPTQVPPQNPMPIRERIAGIDAAQSNLPTQTMAGGGIVAFAGGDLVDDEYDPFDDEDNEEYYSDMEHQARLAQMIAQDDALTESLLDDDMLGAPAGNEKPSYVASTNASTGIKYKDPIPTSGIKAAQYSGDKDQARKYNVGNLRPSGFSYPGQVGVSPGGFAMFGDKDSGIAALNHDIGIKLNRGLDTPTKFISVYAPASDKNDVGAYSANVAKTLGIGPNDKIPNTPEARQLLANAITRQEGAQFATARFAEGGNVKSYNGTTKDKSEVVDDSLKDNEYLQRSRGLTEGVKNLGSGLYDAFTTPKNYDLYDMYQRNIGQPFSRGVSNFVNEPVEAQAAKFRSYSMTPDQTPTVGLTTPAGSSTPVPTSTSAANQATLPMAKKDPNFVYDDKTLAKEAMQDAINVKQKQNKTLDKNINQGDPAPVAQAKAEQTLFEQMQEAIKKREASLESEKSIDGYLALLQGFLGMMGGTSPYAMANIGQGASSGINTLLAARKQTGLTERAIGKDQISLMNARASENYKNAVLGQNEKKLNALAANNRLLESNRVRDDYRDMMKNWNTNNAQMLSLRNNLLGLQAKGKLKKEQEAQLSQIEREMENADVRARKDSGYGVESSGWGIKPVGPK
jgi:hypothetical protein